MEKTAFRPYLPKGRIAMEKLLISVCALSVLSSVATADIIVFKSGVAKKGVIEEETPTSVKIRIEDSVIGVSRENIVRIEYATPEENSEILMEWKEKKDLLREKRRQKREEQEKFEKEQRDKGFVQVGDRWVFPAEAEKMRQEGIRQQIKADENARKAKETPPPPEEPELPEYLDRMPDAVKKAYVEDIRKIDVSQIRTASQSQSQTNVTARIKNNGEFRALVVNVQIQCYDENNELIYADTARVTGVDPDGTGSVYSPVPLESSLIKRVEVNVVGVEWQ
jgi:hypothetical protein